MTLTPSTRYRLALGVASLAVAALALTGCGAPGAGDPEETAEGLVPVKPTEPIVLNILDGGGDLTTNGHIVEQFVADHPELVKELNIQTAPGTDVAGKVLAQQSAGSVDISLVLGGLGILGSEGTGPYLEQVSTYADSLPDLAEIQDEGMSNMQALADGYGVMVRYDKAGPLLIFNDEVVSADEIDTPERLLSWAEANPGRFGYAQPPNSGPGFTFLQALPYLLGDDDPSDPENGWDKTWAYLEKLNKVVTTYPPSSTVMNQAFGAGELDVVPALDGQEIYNRQNGVIPADTAITTFKNQHWIEDAHFAWIPEGVSAEMLYVALALQSAILDEDAQRSTIALGVLNTANKNATIENATAEGKAFLAEWGRPDFYPEALASGTSHTPLQPAVLQKAFDLWQRKIGSQVGN
ncbi:extracellular solute-binding protein [Microbacterium sp. NPDC058389]|uniref:extracellular solute-binding protein n=1 Tax=Microbacterium sp. NPDC058389 TaxID=3346475 RepID=UPI00366264B3